MSPLKVVQREEAKMPGLRTVRLLEPEDDGFDEAPKIHPSDGVKGIKLVDPEDPYALQIMNPHMASAWGDDEMELEYDLFLTLDFHSYTYISNRFTWVSIINKTVTKPKVEAEKVYSEVDTFAPPFGGEYQMLMQANPSFGGSVSYLGDGFYRENEWVEVTATPNENYRFTHWTSDGWGLEGADGSFVNANKAVTAFIMPGNTVTLTAHFEYVEPEPDPPEPPAPPELVVPDEDIGEKTATGWEAFIKSYTNEEETHMTHKAYRETEIGEWVCPSHPESNMSAGDYEEGDICLVNVGTEEEPEICGLLLEWGWISLDGVRSWNIRRDTQEKKCITAKYHPTLGTLLLPGWVMIEAPAGATFNYSSQPFTFWGCYFGYKEHHNMVHFPQAEYDEMEETKCPVCGHELYRLSIYFKTEVQGLEGELDSPFTGGRASNSPVKKYCDHFEG